MVLATISALGQGVESQLGSHLRNSHYLGLSKADLGKVMEQVKKVNAVKGEKAQQVLDKLNLQ